MHSLLDANLLRIENDDLNTKNVSMQREEKFSSRKFSDVNKATNKKSRS